MPFDHRKNIPLLFFLSLAIFLSCTKKDNTAYTSYNKYTNYKLGKCIVYQLDSTVLESFGTRFKTNSYIIKDSVVDRFFDNSNRETYKIYRYQYNSSTDKWVPINTFFLNELGNSLEYVENNLRYIKLINPIVANKYWMGNNYITNSPYYVGDTYFPSWSFSYSNIGEPYKVNGINFPNTVTVVQYDSLENKAFYKFAEIYSYARSYEVYADTIGLIYKDVLNFEQQSSVSHYNCKALFPKTGGGLDTVRVDCTDGNYIALLRNKDIVVIGDSVLNDSYYSGGYGIRQTILSHN